MPKNQTDYSNTVIYKLCCNEPTITDIYIGHTTNFSKRKHQHKTLCCNENDKRYVYQFIRDNGGWDNWKMIQIKEHSCKNKREAEAIEHYWIEQLCPTLNTNKPYAKCKEEPQLYKHCWYEEKKDYILQKSKDFYQENKEEKIQYQKLYSQQNKEKIYENKKIYAEQNKEKIAEQKKIYRENHKEEASKASKEWREANKDKIKEQRSLIVICDCGQQITLANKIRHLQSKNHIDYQNKILETLLSEEEKQKLEEEKQKLQEEQLIKIKEQQKKYREEHDEQIKSYKKIHYDQNKETILEQQRKYKEEHKTEVLEQNKKYMEENKEKIQERQSKWYEENKEKILQKQKELITCECGAQIRKSGKAEHLRSKKHQDIMNSNKTM
jgi:hypothetical protein